ncbi:MAG TPA: type I methionyl aminopeptidase [Candidatus Acidoferrales bacterium]|nr:type I methionyl aminopeptidase [Candidatus Acidoferrales bacterium]
MSIGGERDVLGLRRAGRTVAEVLAALRQEVKPGVTTGELDQRCAELLAQRGARSAPQLFYGFPGAMCISVNDEAVHGVPGRRVLKPGDLVKLDLVIEQNGYVADAAVTVGVPPASPEALRLARCARRALRAAVNQIRADRRVYDVSRAIQSEVERQGFSVIPSLCGHGVGRSIHEEPQIPNFADPRNTDVLTEGLVIAVEPIIAAGYGDVFEEDDGWTIRTADGSLSAHHEHTFIVTRGEPIVVTAGQQLDA